MGKLCDSIRRAVAEERYIIGQHANGRLRERRIPGWQIISGVESAKMLCERPRTKPNPVVEVSQQLADGTEVKVVWSWLSKSKIAKLVTIHFLSVLHDQRKTRQGSSMDSRHAVRRTRRRGRDHPGRGFL